MPKESEKSLVTILVPNIKGQLALVSTFFAEHSINILRLTVSAADRDDKVQKIIAYLEGNRKNVDEACEKLREVDTILKLVNFQTNSEYVEKELCLIKILSENSKLSSLANLVTDFGGKVVFSNEKATIFALEDNEGNVNDFVNKAVKVSKKIEISRSGMVVMGVDKNIDDLIEINL
ncbi:MAG: acetolactate synthase small subunit [Rickettsiales bacterium]|jgi:acetolactate synthase-1/3 small subunit|nr:acetolactate synthase small subunit [Rickettsiales bacterium]